MSEPLVSVIRGGRVESIHRGDWVVVDIQGRILAHKGDPMKRTFWRSSAKPFQAIPTLESGAESRFSMSTEEISLLCASHNGEVRHVETALGLLEKLGLSADNLDCGAAQPMLQEAAFETIKRGESFSPLQNPCSGKHSGMLALCLLKGWPLENYISKDHPVQREMLKSIAHSVSMAEGDIGLAIDGCGVPVFELPIYNMALAYARLSQPEAFFKDDGLKAARRVASAMTNAPFFVAGTKRLDTNLMEVTKGRILAKLGAESVYCISLMSKGIGIALKIDDGSYRGIDPVIIDLLRRMGALSDDELEALSHHRRPLLKNHRKEVIGHLECTDTSDSFQFDATWSHASLE
ncbi:asparaginase [Acidaminobacter hydrogenoformans]|uniref:Asparaginase n=1 Tax=Acidaminobacter hydrogenoformans DSM 2784 TaxID=1120920 RepID=A0A1G5RV07_9FIRM|nr:asparaginase [Acidaminobacter hydrogenoformans]SCZ77708.1 asparaginase [Acidaminobacter hydrogenoformans DSM 2784]